MQETPFFDDAKGAYCRSSSVKISTNWSGKREQKGQTRVRRLLWEDRAGTWKRENKLFTNLFALNRHLVLQNPGIIPLRYIGVGSHVYCCMSPVPCLSKPLIAISVEYVASDGARNVEKYQTVKLSPDQAHVSVCKETGHGRHIFLLIISKWCS